MPSRTRIAIGDVYGSWTVIGDVVHRGALLYVECECACGHRGQVRPCLLATGKSSSCGCRVGIRHGLYGTPEYKTWVSIKSRCNNPKHRFYHRYGGRGIKVCERWSESPEAFVSDMGPRPGDDYTIERKDNDGNYEPDNCVWLQEKLQNRNRSCSRHLTFNGETLCVAEWARKMNMSKDALRSRLKMGWPVDIALTAPVERRGRVLKKYLAAQPAT